MLSLDVCFLSIQSPFYIDCRSFKLHHPNLPIIEGPSTFSPISMLAETSGSPYAGGDAPKLRTACENCRQSKVKCNLSGKNVCTRCLRHGLQCQYGFANRSGKPKGSKNRATLRKLGQLQEDKPPMRGFRGSRLVPPVPMPDRDPMSATGYSAHVTDPMLDDEVSPVRNIGATHAEFYRFT